MSEVYIAVIGPGGVGKAFISQLAQYASISPRPLSTILIQRSSQAIISKDYSPIDLASWSSAPSSPPLGFPKETQNFLNSCPGPVILVDNTSSADIAAHYPSFLASGISIVTPNKKAFSDRLALWDAIYAASANKGYPGGGYIFHEATVGAALPALSTLIELRETGDQVKRIEGVFSGTMSFLFNGFAPLGGDNGGRSFAECVREARELGYTEPDPRDDLNGLDVARKLTILARLSGLRVESATSFPIQSLVPETLESVETAEEFLEKLEGFNGKMNELKADAESKGGVIRFVGSLDVETKKISVGLKTFDKGSAIAGLKGSDNIICFYTKRYGERALIVQGAGAGYEVTAMGVLGDMIKVLQRLK